MDILRDILYNGSGGKNNNQPLFEGKNIDEQCAIIIWNNPMINYSTIIGSLMIL